MFEIVYFNNVFIVWFDKYYFYVIIINKENNKGD